MAFAIPRIQYKNVDTTGTTVSGNATISAIPVTTDIEVGMFARGSGVPTGATVASKTSSSVTLTAPKVASASASLVALSFGYEILFDYPPVEPTGEALVSKANTNESLSGIQQTSLSYIEGKRKLKFSFISQTLYVSLNTFMTTWALLGEAFRYYEDQTLTTYTTYELIDLKSEPKKISSKGVDVYVWDYPLNFRRIVV